MKKIIIPLVILLIIPIIGVNRVNNKNYELETVTNTYTKEEIDSKLEEIRTSINNNKTSIEENKNILIAIQNKLNDYALKTALNTANSNIDSLNTVATNNTNKITTIENGKTLIAESITNKGITTANTDSFETMANNITNIKTQTGAYGKWTIDVGKVVGYDSSTKTWYQPNAPTGIMVVTLTITEDGNVSVSSGAGSATITKIS